jgi:hypothetical protein
VIVGLIGTSSPAVAQAPDDGDGGPAPSASLAQPRGLAVTADGGVLIADFAAHRVRRVSPSGTISTFAGTGAPGLSGDGGPAAAAQLAAPTDVAVRPDGSVVIADLANRRVRRVDPAGVITTLAGTGGEATESGNGGPATAAQFSGPQFVAALPDGSTLVTSGGGASGQVRRIDPAGNISAFAGTGSLGTAGNCGPATAAELGYISGLASAPDGSVLITSSVFNEVRRVDPTGTMSKVAGSTLGPPTPPGEFSGDGGPAVGADLDAPAAPVARPGGGFLFFDVGNLRVRAVDPAGTITTFAGSGARGPVVDGRSALSTDLIDPVASFSGGLASLADGSLLFATGNRVRRVGADGTVTTFAGGNAPLPIPPAPTPTPVAGRSATSGPVTGTVTVRRPRGSRFVRLLPGVAVPSGSELDTTRGTVTLTLRGVGGRAYSARVSLGRTVFTQGSKRSRYLVDLRLTGPGCRAAAPANDRRAPLSTGRYPKPRSRASRASTRAAKPTRKPRRLRVKRTGSGEVRTRTNDGAAVARGTDWRTTETCTGTSYAVTEGRIAVHDLVRGGTRNVGRGGRLTVRRR